MTGASAVFSPELPFRGVLHTGKCLQDHHSLLLSHITTTAAVLLPEEKIFHSPFPPKRRDPDENSQRHLQPAASDPIKSLRLCAIIKSNRSQLCQLRHFLEKEDTHEA